MSICYLVGAGDFTAFSKEAGDLVIAADGGYVKALASCRPDVLVGDFDSLPIERPEGVETHAHPVKKDETDMMLAYRIGAKKCYREFVIVGGTGGRPDHTFANYSLLLHIAEQGNSAKMIDASYEYSVVKNSEFLLELSSSRSRTVSVFAIGGEARGVDIAGLEYEVEDVTLSPSFALGVSNAYVGRPARISVRSGALLIMWERG